MTHVFFLIGIGALGVIYSFLAMILSGGTPNATGEERMVLPHSCSALSPSTRPEDALLLAHLALRPPDLRRRGADRGKWAEVL